MNQLEKIQNQNLILLKVILCLSIIKLVIIVLQLL